MSTAGQPEEHRRDGLAILALGALGVVYGDIGTSPLYAIKECFHGPHAIKPTPDHVLGVLSLIFWSLVLVISIKYLLLILRADNEGEGGILALMALVRPDEHGRVSRWLVIVLGLFGASLLYGDGMITPAISVLSAVEGLGVATNFFEPYIVPITIAILVGLFAFQYKGTAGVGAVFGPITLVWFITLGVLGVVSLAQSPEAFVALNPLYGARFLLHGGWHAFIVLGTVFLVVTGGEALYADLGHFGRRPIQITWFVIVLPCLLVNYFGQGALLLRNPDLARNPLYLMTPSWALYPMVGLACAATVIASQAVITGAYSLTRQAVQLGYCPRVLIRHTSSAEIGQVYLPGINWVLLVCCLGLVIGFKSSSNLAAAYGVAVTTTMVITTLLAFVVMRRVWGWSLLLALPVTAGFLVIDLGFFGANLTKIPDGGWFPLVVAGLAFTVLTTWRRGREILRDRLREMVVPLETFLATVRASQPHRVSGTGVYMTGSPDATPPALISNERHNQVLHQRVVLLTLAMEQVPRVPHERQAEVAPIEGVEGFWRVVGRYGFMQTPDVPALLRQCAALGLEFEMEQTTFFLGRENLIATPRPGMAIWREKLFGLMSRNALQATAYFGLPAERVVELGVRVEL